MSATDGIGDYNRRKDEDRRAADKRLQEALDVLDGLKAHGVTYGPEYDDAREEVKRAEHAYDLAAYTGD